MLIWIHVRSMATPQKDFGSVQEAVWVESFIIYFCQMQCAVQLGSSQWSSCIGSISRCMGVLSKIACYKDLSTTTQILSFTTSNLQLKPETLSAVLISCSVKDDTYNIWVSWLKYLLVHFCSSLVAYQAMAQPNSPHRYATKIYQKLVVQKGINSHCVFCICTIQHHISITYM